MANIQYRLSTKTIGNNAEVLVRFYHNHTQLRAKTHIYVPVGAWNNKDGTLSIPRRITEDSAKLSELQVKLNDLTAKIYDRFLEDQHLPLTSAWLQQVADKQADYTAIPHERNVLTIPELIEECKVDKLNKRVIEQQRGRHYDVLRRDMERFADAIRPLYANRLIPDDVNDIMDWYRVEDITRKSGEVQTVQRGDNTISGKMRVLRAVCKWAVRKGKMHESPFGEEGDDKAIVPKERYGSVIYLTIEERDALMNYQQLPDDLKVARDIFIFQCHVGCRVSDLFNLTEDNLRDGGKFLEYCPQKTARSSGVIVRIPLSDDARNIIERYHGQQGAFLMPQIGSVQYNAAIHNFTRMAGLKRKVIVMDTITRKPVTKELWQVCTSHVGRKTYTENIYKVTGDRMTTSAFSGHVPNSRELDRYTNVDDDMKLEILKKVNS